MKITTHKVATLAATLITYGALAGGANAVLTITDLTVSPTGATISISGVVDAGFTPGVSESDVAFVGAATFDNWILAEAVLVSEINGLAATSNLVYTNTNVPIANNFGSDWFRFASPGAWSGGEIIDYTASFTGSFDISQAPPTALIVQGYSDLGNLIATGGEAGSGTVSTVPEPSSAFLTAFGILGFAARRRRTR